MTFHIYRCEQRGGRDVLHFTDEEFRLAGYNLLYRAWVKRGKPIREGWRISADELIQIFSDGKESYESRRLIIDYQPSNMTRIPLIEIQEIFLFNWGEAPAVTWTPMMLRMRDVLDHWCDLPMSPAQRRARMAELEIEAYGGDFVEFLYLQGDSGSWKWGRNGATNAVFLHDEARDYFRQFF